MVSTLAVAAAETLPTAVVPSAWNSCAVTFKLLTSLLAKEAAGTVMLAVPALTSAAVRV